MCVAASSGLSPSPPKIPRMSIVMGAGPGDDAGQLTRHPNKVLLVVAAIMFKFYHKFYCKFYCTCDQPLSCQSIPAQLQLLMNDYNHDHTFLSHAKLRIQSQNRGCICTSPPPLHLEPRQSLLYEYLRYTIFMLIPGRSLASSQENSYRNHVMHVTCTASHHQHLLITFTAAAHISTRPTAVPRRYY